MPGNATNRDLAKPEERHFSTTQLNKFGFAAGGGLDFSFDWNKFKELTAACKEH
jgi:hypothetical protein